MGECVVLQAGSQANFAGSHFWNLQECSGDTVNHDRLYTRQKSGVYLPRAVLIDASGCTGALDLEPEAHVGVREQLEALQFDNTVAVVEMDQVPMHPFLKHMMDESAWAGGDYEGSPDDLEADGEDDAGEAQDPQVTEERPLRQASEFAFRETVRYWTDYLTASIPVANLLQVSPLYPPALFASRGALERPGLAEAGWERARHALEACDSVVALHALLDADGYGDLGAAVVREWRDEVPKSSVSLWAIEAPEDEPFRVAAVAALLAAVDLDGNSTSLCPLLPSAWETPPGAAVRADACDGSRYVTGGLVAAALDTATFPYRVSRPSVGARALWDVPSLTPVRGLELAWAVSGAAEPAVPAVDRRGYPLPAPEEKATPEPPVKLAQVFRTAAAGWAAVQRGGGPPTRVCAEFREQLGVRRAPTLDVAFDAPVHLPLPFPQDLFSADVTTEGARGGRDGDVVRAGVGVGLHGAELPPLFADALRDARHALAAYVEHEELKEMVEKLEEITHREDDSE